MARSIPALLICLMALPGRNALAQQAQVQLPVQQRFEVHSTVSVPDHGAIHLGGVGRQAADRINSGFLPGGSRLGHSSSSLSSSAHVTIQDFSEMDARLLGAMNLKVSGLSSEQRTTRARDILRTWRR